MLGELFSDCISPCRGVQLLKTLSSNTLFLILVFFFFHRFLALIVQILDLKDVVFS